MLIDRDNPKHMQVEQRLWNEQILWIASVRPEGRPHLVPVWYLWDGEAFYIFSQSKAQKIANLRRNPRVTLALNTSPEGEEVAIIEGQAKLLPRPEWPDILQAYQDKYGDQIKAFGWTMETMAADYSLLIRVTPHKLLAW